jgi:hypothetical protein
LLIGLAVYLWDEGNPHSSMFQAPAAYLVNIDVVVCIHGDPSLSQMMQLQPSLLFWPYLQVSLSNEIYPYLYLSVLVAYLWNKPNLHRGTFQAPGTYLVNTNAGH